jgi:hypothetical protein
MGTAPADIPVRSALLLPIIKNNPPIADAAAPDDAIATANRLASRCRSLRRRRACSIPGQERRRDA